jgi:hypothetical protein
VGSEQRHVGFTHEPHRGRGRVGVVGRTLVLVDQHELAAPERRRLIEHRGHLTEVGPHGGVERVAVDRHLHIGPHPVQREMQRDAEGHGPVVAVEGGFDHLPIQIDGDHVLRSQLFPVQQPRVAPEGAVASADRDVTGEMIVVALTPQGPGQQRQLLSRGELRHQAVGGRRECHGQLPTGSRAGKVIGSERQPVTLLEWKRTFAS